MPQLPNRRHEVFAQFLAEGFSQSRAYAAANFAPNTANASRLARTPAIEARVQERLSYKEASRARLHGMLMSTLERLLEGIEVTDSLEHRRLAFNVVHDMMRLEKLAPTLKAID
jgi:hypothetical protein